MMTVGIRELKAKLSGYVNEVRAGGKPILITDRGEEVALITPLSVEYRLIRYLEVSGKVVWAKEKPSGLEKAVVVRGGPLSATILEERK